MPNAPDPIPYRRPDLPPTPSPSDAVSLSLAGCLGGFVLMGCVGGSIIAYLTDMPFNIDHPWNRKTAVTLSFLVAVISIVLLIPRLRDCRPRHVLMGFLLGIALSALLEGLCFAGT